MTVRYLSQRPVDDFSLAFSDEHYSATLAASTNTVFTLPTTAPLFKVLIKVSGTSPVWVAEDFAASAPVGASFASTRSEMIMPYTPFCREVQGGHALNFYTGGTGVEVSISLYSLYTIK